MEKRVFGRTGLELSVLGFGCGAVGGLMVKGAAAEQERAVARAVEAGINYFDTAAMYGEGESERNLGHVLKKLRPHVFLGTKVRLRDRERGAIAGAVAASLDASLQRLGREKVDLFQLHNAITLAPQPGTLTPDVVLGEVVPAFERLRAAGKIRFFGITAVGDTAALRHVVEAAVFDSAQVPYNMLNPSAGQEMPADYPAQDYAELFLKTEAARMGVIAIRVLAAGALSGSEERHPLGSPQVAPIASGADYRSDVARARRLSALVAEGFAGTLAEAATRFAMTHRAVTTALVGYSTIEQLDAAIAAAEKGPLPPAALDRLAALQAAFAGEPP